MHKYWYQLPNQSSQVATAVRHTMLTFLQYFYVSVKREWLAQLQHKIVCGRTKR